MASAAIPKVRPRRSDAEASRRAILTAARELLAERGQSALTVSEVAHRAGINRSTAYQHFRTREELLSAVLSEFSEQIEQLLSDDAPIGEKLDQFADFFLAHPECARSWIDRMLSPEPAADRQGRGRAWLRYVASLRRLAESPRSQQDIDPEMLAHILLSATLLWSLRVRGSSRKQAEVATRRFSRELKRLLLHGVLRAEAWPDLVRSIEGPE